MSCVGGGSEGAGERGIRGLVAGCVFAEDEEVGPRCREVEVAGPQGTSGRVGGDA